MKKTLLLTLAMSGLASGAFACEKHLDNPAEMPCCQKGSEMPCMKNLADSHHGHGSNHAAHASTDNASTAAYKAGMATMHTNMDITYTGDSDIDFLRGMIPHHQGAVDMAKTVLEYGEDPQVRRMAKDVIRAQNAEIAWMTNWLAQLEAKGVKPSSNTPRKVTATDKTWAGDTWMNER